MHWSVSKHGGCPHLSSLFKTCMLSIKAMVYNHSQGRKKGKWNENLVPEWLNKLPCTNSFQLSITHQGATVLAHTP